MAHSEKKRFEALQLYVGGHSLEDIADKLGVAASSVKRWKSEYRPEGLTWEQERHKKQVQALAKLEVGLSEDLDREIGRTREMLEELHRRSKDSVVDIPPKNLLAAYLKVQERLLTLLGELPGETGKHLLVVGSADAAVFAHLLLEEIAADADLGPVWKRVGERIKDNLRQKLKVLACHENTRKALTP